MKLELKHIAGYLPYGLKVRRDSDSTHVHVTRLIDGISIYDEGISLKSSRTHIGFLHELTHIPIFRPMSDLYKPIEDGSIPIVELAKIEYPCSTYHILKNGYVEVAWENGGSARFAYQPDEEGSFINTCFDCWEVYYPVRNQVELFDYLYQHHFDIYNLIEQGLAIGINSIN